MRSSSRHLGYPYIAFLGWLVLAGLTVFGAGLLAHYQFFDRLLEVDKTYLSILILIIFFVVSLVVGQFAWTLSAQFRLAQEVQNAPTTANLDGTGNTSWSAEYLFLLDSANGQSQAGDSDSDAAYARLLEQVYRGLNLGWFVSDVLVRIGLIGTVIGFVLMLNSVYQIKEGDIAVLRELMQQMGGGMQVALYTTITGITCGLLLSIQCYWLDRCAGRFVSSVMLLPALATQTKA